MQRRLDWVSLPAASTLIWPWPALVGLHQILDVQHGLAEEVIALRSQGREVAGGWRRWRQSTMP